MHVISRASPLAVGPLPDTAARVGFHTPRASRMSNEDNQGAKRTEQISELDDLRPAERTDNRLSPGVPKEEVKLPDIDIREVSSQGE
jgi:hypothetical protein